jgi:hypothetical protein
MTPPILFLIFNRPDKTARVFDVIREAKPSRLYIASDGPRCNRDDERDLVQEARRIVGIIDWPCEIFKYREENLGCRVAVSEAITWFFQQEEAGVILEDDCLPDASFFSFAQVMLKTYNHDSRVFHINGSNLLSTKSENTVTSSYYFSKNVHVWGWASWARAWAKYSIDMVGLEDQETTDHIQAQFSEKKIGKFWISLFRHNKKIQANTWDAQWAYTVLKNDGLCITPQVNLIENIGFDTSATHTRTDDNGSYKEKSSLDTVQVLHPFTPSSSSLYIVREDLDNEVSNRLYIRTLFQKITQKIKATLQV